jgi:predicted transcriptional regulator
MPENVNARVTRLEESMGRAFTAIEVLAEKQEKLDDVLVLLTEAQIKTQERFKETADRLRETDQHLREIDQRSRERDRNLDERVDKLVSAIGEMLRNGRAK